MLKRPANMLRSQGVGKAEVIDDFRFTIYEGYALVNRKSSILNVARSIFAPYAAQAVADFAEGNVFFDRFDKQRHQVFV